MANSGASQLAALFEEFYRELLDRRRAVAEATFEAGGDPQRGAAQAATVWQALLTKLEQQALEVRRTSGDFTAELYREAQYVMAALADEIFLNLDWAGRAGWQAQLLESKLFGTHRAGDEVFARLGRLLQNQDPAFRSLGEVYLAALTLGFQGRYRGRPDADEALGVYRQRLYRFLAERDPVVFAGKQRLSPAAYGVTMSQGVVTRLPYGRRIFWLFVAGIAAWVLVTWPFWNRLTGELRPTLEEILASP
jgi:type VI secretion system protein ImpK